MASATVLAVAFAATATDALPAAPLMVMVSAVMPLVPKPLVVAVVPMVALAAVLTFWLLPYTLVRALAVAATMVWLALAPIWNWAVPKVPSSRRWPLNSVLVEMRSSSAMSWLTSAFRA